MIVNLYVDHMMTTPPATAEEVWNATKEHPRIYSEAARRIGLSNAEYREFRNALLDGRAIYVTLPARIDAMAGDRHGSIYAVRNAVMTHRVMGWKVTLASGAVVYVPQTCGNLAMSRPVSYVRPVKHHHVKVVVRVVPAATPTPTIVVMQPTPMPYQPQPTPVPAVASNNNWLYAIPIIGGLVWIVTQPSHPPSCSQGSNEFGACQKSH